MTGRCLVFRKHLQYPAIQMSAACRINTEVPQWTPARPTQVFSLSLCVCVCEDLAIEYRTWISGQGTLQLAAAFISHVRLLVSFMQTLDTSPGDGNLG